MKREFSDIQVHDIKRKAGYDGFFKIGIYSFSHELFNGGQSPIVTREVFERGTAAAVLPYDPNTDEVLLIQQFLIGAQLSGTPNRPLQVIAGMVEKGEAGMDVARREAEEEAGITLKGRITPALAFLPSPGGSSERIETFVAEADLSNAGGVFGLAEENEDIRAQVFSAEEAIRMLDSGEIQAGPAVVVLSWFARYRAELQARWAKE